MASGLLLSLLPCYSLVILLIHVLLLPHAASVSFNFDFATGNYASELNYSNDSYWAKPVIELTKADRYAGINDSVGRVWYAQPVPLWDPSTGVVASFTTSFSFQIISGNDSMYGPGDGMAFFLSYYPSATPPHSFGGALGLFSGPVGNATATGDERVVAVEFDTHSNGDWESDSHIGIDVNSIVSVASKDVVIADSGGSGGHGSGSITLSSGLPMAATVTYHNDTTLLSVDLQIEGAPYPYHVSTNVDMTKCLPDTVAVGFSAATGDFFELHQLLSWSFSSDLAAAVPRKSHSQLPPPTTPSPSTTVNASAAAAAAAWPHDSGVGGAAAEGPAGSKKQQHGVRAETLALVIVSSLLCIVVIACALKMAASRSRCRWYGKQHAREKKIGHGPRRYQYCELVKATNKFDELRKLGRGGSGEVYRGEDDKGRQVAVKKLTSIGTTDEEALKRRREFQAEVEIISRLRHKNLVRLFGWCDSSNGLHLVYELIPRGSLDNYLYPTDERPLGPPLSWDDRYRIIIGLGKALVYLHGEHSGTKYVVHGDIKPSNIMLDEELNAKLGDFGLARLVDHGAAPPTTNIVMGTRGYVEPEFMETHKRCKESDVYSFGIVLLEMVTGHGPMSQPLRQRVWELYGQGKILEAASAALRSSESNDRQMERVLVVGLWCTQQARSERPPIERAMGALEHAAGAVSPPDLPLTLAGAHMSEPPEQRLQIHGDDVALVSSHYSNTAPATATAGEQAYGGSSSAVPAAMTSSSVHPSSATHSTSYTTCSFGAPGASTPSL